MSDFIAALMGIGFIVLIVLFFQWYLKVLNKWSLKALQKRLEKGKIKDKRLMKLYKSTDKYRKNTFFAVIMGGVFFKWYLNLYQAQYELYKAEAEKRGLI